MSSSFFRRFSLHKRPDAEEDVPIAEVVNESTFQEEAMPTKDKNKKEEEEEEEVVNFEEQARRINAQRRAAASALKKARQEELNATFLAVWKDKRAKAWSMADSNNLVYTGFFITDEDMRGNTKFTDVEITTAAHSLNLSEDYVVEFKPYASSSESLLISWSVFFRLKSA